MIDLCTLGTGGALPLPERGLASLYVRMNGHGLLIDCGENTQTAIAQPVHILEKRQSAIDDTVKFLFGLKDGNCVEGVLMHYHHGYTLCISTQVGCRMGCTFCASTLEGCVRSLTSGEMLGEILCANRFLAGKDRVHNVVLMGSGEPLDNYDNVMKFLRLLREPDGVNIGLRNVSLST